MTEQRIFNLQVEERKYEEDTRLKDKMYGKHIRTDTPEQIEWTLNHIKEAKAKNKAVLDANREELE